MYGFHCMTVRIGAGAIAKKLPRRRLNSKNTHLRKDLLLRLALALFCLHMNSLKLFPFMALSRAKTSTFSLT